MKKNLSIIIPSLANGGAERVASILSLHLSDNYNQHIMLYDASKIDYDYNGEIIDLSFKITKNPIKKIYLMAKRIDKIRSLKRNLNIDISISFLDSVNILNLLSKRNDKTILTVHSYKSKVLSGIRGKVIKLLIMLLYKKSNRIVAVSNMVKRDLIDVFNVASEKIDVIYNSIELKKIELVKLEPLPLDHEKIFENHDVIINVGRLTRAKGQESLINAFANVKKKRKNTKLVILGNGELNSELEKQANLLGLTDDIHFLGYQTNVYKYIAKSKVLVSSSLWEGFGNVLIEAMACGTPVISTDCKAGPREILAPDTNPMLETNKIEYAEYGILTPVPKNNLRGNLQSQNEELFLTKAIIEMLENDIRRESYIKKGIVRAKEFDIESIIRKWKDLLINI